MMRQAGRYQPEYRALKERAGGFWGLCTTPEHIAEATVFAQQSLDTDAAIIFSDITVPAWAMGLDLEFAPGPRFAQAVRTRADVDRLRPLAPARVDFLSEGIRQTRARLDDAVSLIGFVGAPLTVAGYVIEGYPSRNWVELKRMAYGDPELLQRLLDRLSESLVTHARLQVEAGCDALQLFDTTAGVLAPAELERFAFGSARRVLDGLRDLGVPLIYFARDVGAHLEAAASVHPDVLGVDWTLSLAEARRRVGGGVALMGNLDPTTLFCPGEVVRARVEAILEEVGHQPGFVFNLGHGILPETPVANAKLVVDTVHAFEPRGA